MEGMLMTLLFPVDTERYRSESGKVYDFALMKELEETRKVVIEAKRAFQSNRGSGNHYIIGCSHQLYVYQLKVKWKIALPLIVQKLRTCISNRAYFLFMSVCYTHVIEVNIDVPVLLYSISFSLCFVFRIWRGNPFCY